MPGLRPGPQTLRVESPLLSYKVRVTMGNDLSKAEKHYLQLLRHLLQTARVQVKEGQLAQLLREGVKYNPWFLEESTLDIENWDRVRENLTTAHRRGDLLAVRYLRPSGECDWSYTLYRLRDHARRRCPQKRLLFTLPQLCHLNLRMIFHHRHLHWIQNCLGKINH